MHPERPRSSRRDGLRLYLVAATATFALSLPVPVYWDSWGYVRQAIAGDVGGLGLGRPIFVLTSQAVTRAWLAAGGSVWHVEPLLRIFWAAVACAAAPLTSRLARLCGLPPRAAFLAGLAVACSPAMAHVSGTLLTDAPAGVLVLASLVLGGQAVTRPARGMAAAAGSGAVLGLAIGVREQSVVAGLGLALLLWAAPRDRRLALAAAMASSAALAAIVPTAVVLMAQPGYVDTVRGWLAGMAHDRALKTFGLLDAAVLIGWLLSLGPAAVIAAATAIATRPVWRAPGILFAIVTSSLAQLVAATGFLGIAYSPRFLLAGLPGAIAIPGAIVLDRWASISAARLALVLGAIAAPLLVAVPIVRSQAALRVETLRAFPAMLFALPDDSVIVTGYPCPAVALVREQVAHDRGERPDWVPVCPGWAWPENLSATLDGFAREGRPIAIDLRETAWVGAEQRAAFAEAAEYARQRDRVIVWR